MFYRQVSGDFTNRERFCTTAFRPTRDYLQTRPGGLTSGRPLLSDVIILSGCLGADGNWTIVTGLHPIERRLQPSLLFRPEESEVYTGILRVSVAKARRDSAVFRIRH